MTGTASSSGVDTIGVRRGHTFYVQNQLIGGNAEVEFKFGRDGDEILVGDWNAHGYDTFAVRRGVTIYAQNQLIGGNAEVEFKYGRERDDLFAGDPGRRMATIPSPVQTSRHRSTSRTRSGRVATPKIRSTSATSLTRFSLATGMAT